MEDLELIMLMYQSEQFAEYFRFYFDRADSFPKNDNIHHMSCLLSYADEEISSFENDVETRVIRY